MRGHRDLRGARTASQSRLAWECRWDGQVSEAGQPDESQKM